MLRPPSTPSGPGEDRGRCLQERERTMIRSRRERERPAAGTSMGKSSRTVADNPGPPSPRFSSPRHAPPPSSRSPVYGGPNMQESRRISWKEDKGPHSSVQRLGAIFGRWEYIGRGVGNQRRKVLIGRRGKPCPKEVGAPPTLFGPGQDRGKGLEKPGRPKTEAPRSRSPHEQ